jgi:hypothetical protein
LNAGPCAYGASGEICGHQVVGFMKGKSGIHLARVYDERKRGFCRTALLGARVLRIDRGP